MDEISEAVRRIIRNTAKKLKGAQKREFIAEVTLELLDGSPRKAEREFGWGRETVKKGIRELTTRIRCVDNYNARGNKRTEERLPDLSSDIHRIMNVDGNVNPHFENYFTQGKVTPGAVRRILIDEFGYPDDALPNTTTIGNILARLGYRVSEFSKPNERQRVEG